jgi:hypothetical protein
MSLSIRFKSFFVYSIANLDVANTIPLRTIYNLLLLLLRRDIGLSTFFKRSAERLLSQFPVTTKLAKRIIIIAIISHLLINVIRLLNMVNSSYSRPLLYSLHNSYNGGKRKDYYNRNRSSIELMFTCK